MEIQIQIKSTVGEALNVLCYIDCKANNSLEDKALVSDYQKHRLLSIETALRQAASSAGVQVRLGAATL